MTATATLHMTTAVSVVPVELTGQRGRVNRNAVGTEWNCLIEILKIKQQPPLNGNKNTDKTSYRHAAPTASYRLGVEEATHRWKSKPGNG